MDTKKMNAMSDFKNKYGKVLFWNTLIVIALFLSITIMSQSNRFITINVRFDDIQKNNYLVRKEFAGVYNVQTYNRFNIKRIEQDISISELPVHDENHLDFLREFIELQLSGEGWKPSPDQDFDKHDCNFLIPETSLGYDQIMYYAYRQQQYQPRFENNIGKLICLSMIENKKENKIKVILVTSTPTFLEYIMSLLSS
ncbi:MAG: hypothetical protein JEZ00_19200 [Anaerolineaceae bacterium]|nr:hypothetical protein [Anaerolineaceae bacterium]